MKLLNSIVIGEHEIKFGVADTDLEERQVFELRYKVYVEKKNYIPAELCPNGLEFDGYDTARVSTHFMAMVDGTLVGTIRVIQKDPLPISSYFKFDEPEGMVLPPDKKIEIGRFVSIGGTQGVYFPRHLISIGLFESVVRFAEEHHIEGGYGAIKSYILKKLRKIDFPIYEINPSELIYSVESSDPLKNFFNNSDDPVVPTYFLRTDARAYLNALFGSRAFKQLNDSAVIFKSDLFLGLAILKNKFS